MVGYQRGANGDGEGSRNREPRSGRKFLSGAGDDHGNDRHVRAPCGAESTRPEASQPGSCFEGPLGEKRQRVTGVGRFEKPPCHHPLLTSVLTVYELGADSPQQETGERETRHLVLDHESESRWQRGGENNPVEITRVIGNYDTSAVRQDSVAPVPNRAPDRHEESSGEPARHAAAGIPAWNDRKND